MNNGREDDKRIIDAAKALHKERFTIIDVYYAIHQRRTGRNQGRNLQPTPYEIRAALERNGAQVVERGAKTSRPLYSFLEGDK